MSLFPQKTDGVTRHAQTSIGSVRNVLLAPVLYSLATAGAVVADVDYFVASVVMGVKTYTIVAGHGTMPGLGARNVTAKVTKVSGFDTPGTLVVTGTDLSGAVITETIIPVDGTAQGLKAFRTVVSVVGAGWVVDAGVDKDTIEIGFGDLIGLPNKLARNTVIGAWHNGVREGTAPAVTFSTTVLSLNTVDLATALTAAADIVYLA